MKDKAETVASDWKALLKKTPNADAVQRLVDVLGVRKLTGRVMGRGSEGVQGVRPYREARRRNSATVRPYREARRRYSVTVRADREARRRYSATVRPYREARRTTAASRPVS